MCCARCSTYNTLERAANTTNTSHTTHTHTHTQQAAGRKSASLACRVRAQHQHTRARARKKIEIIKSEYYANYDQARGGDERRKKKRRVVNCVIRFNWLMSSTSRSACNKQQNRTSRNIAATPHKKSHREHRPSPCLCACIVCVLCAECARVRVWMDGESVDDEVVLCAQSHACHCA